MSMITLIPVKCRIKEGEKEKLIDVISDNIEDRDIVVIASKVVSYSENRLVKLADVEPSEKAKEIASQYGMRPELAELTLQESDEILGGYKGFLNCVKYGTLSPNAGIDTSNCPPGYAVLYPVNPKKTTDKIVSDIKNRTGKTIGVVIADSRILPLRKGVNGLALATSGFKSMTDERGKKDIYGKELKHTFRNVADMLAAASELLMGEADEMTPIVIVRGLETEFNENDIPLDVKKEECLYLSDMEKIRK